MVSTYINTEVSEKECLRTLLNYGQDGAITSKKLATLINSTDREVRLIIRELIAERVPVASSTDGKNGGYFIANTQAEAKDYIGKLRHRIIEDCLRLRDFKRGSRPLLNPGQLPLI